MLILAIIFQAIAIIITIVLIVFNYLKQDHPNFNLPYVKLFRIIASILFILAIIFYYFAFNM